MIIRAKAPLRIGFCGGGTDIPPYCDSFGGVVLNTTIDKFAYVSLLPRKDKDIIIKSADFNKTITIKNGDIQYNGELDLIKSVIKHYNLNLGFDLFINCDTSPGSGLGTSSSLTVAIISCLQHIQGRLLSRYETAELAYFIERKCLGSKGGKQDQFASAFGGFNFIEFYENTTVVNTLRINHDVLNELNYRLILFYLRIRRKKTAGKEQLNMNKNQRKIEKYLNNLKEITIEMKKVLLKCQIDSFGYLLHEAWILKRKTLNQTTNHMIDDLYNTVRKNGVYGGKMLGAGGGGFLLLYSQFDKKQKIEKIIREFNGKIIDFSFENNGVQSWSVKQ